MHRVSPRNATRSKPDVGAASLQAKQSALQALDFLFIGGGAGAAGPRRVWRASAKDNHLRSKSLRIEDMAGQSDAHKLDALIRQIGQMRQRGSIGAATQIVLDFHGFEHNGELWLTTDDQGAAAFTVKAEELMRRLRAVLADPADPDQAASPHLVHLRCCFGGLIRNLLKSTPGGLTLIHAGNKACLTDDGTNTINQIIKNFKRGPRSDRPLSQDQKEKIWSTARAHSGENIAFVGRGRIRKHNALRTACDAAADKTLEPARRGRVIAAKLDHGSMKSVRLLMGRDPRQAYGQSQFGADIPLHIAARSARESGAKINYLVEVLGHDVNKTHEHQSTVSHSVAQFDRADALRTLIHQGADVLKADSDHYLALHRCAKSQRDTRQKIEVLLSADPQGRVDRPGPTGCSVLQLAIQLSNVEAVTTLLHCGADPGFKDDGGRTAFDYLATVTDAAIRTELLELLHRAQSGVNQRDVSGSTALHLKAAYGTVAEVQSLLGQHADAAMRDAHGALPIHQAAARSSTDTLAKIQTLSALPGLDIHARDLNGNTPLHYAALTGNEEAMAALLKLGADPGLPNQFGILPIHCARKNVAARLLQAMKNSGKGVQTLPDLSLLLHGIVASSRGGGLVPRLMALPGALERRDSKGVTVLAEAVLKGNLKMARLLLDAGAHANVRFDDGRTLLDHVQALQMDEMQALLVEYGADPDW